ncbi:sensor histidine kinase [Caballeronia glebae]|uniref:sensor histidine kinase n=1 Tax=Caballeronia glebae TaxID=1777143 RepID=UPI0038BAB96B
MTSIRRWLLGWLIPGLSLAALTAGFGIFHTAQEEASELFDYELRTVALSMPANTGTDGSYSRQGPDFQGIRDDRLLIQIWDQTGKNVYRSLDETGLVRFPPGIRTIERDDLHWRVFGIRDGDRFVQVAQPVSVRKGLALKLALRTLWPLALFFPAIVLFVLWVVCRGLMPLRTMSAALKTRSVDSLEPLLLPDQTPIEVQPLVVALNDLLSRLKAASELQRTFVADAAHELRTPLAALKLQLQAAQRDGSLTGSKQTFERIEGRLNRMIHLVHQLLELARVDSKGAPNLEAIDVLRLCERAVADFSLLAEAKQVDLGLERSSAADAGDLYQAYVDSNGIAVLLSNLIDNAVRYTPSGGKVDVILQRDDDQISVAVADTGPGIPDGERERVFERFHRGTETTGQGSGLGLAIALKIAERHGAMLKAKNRAGGRGLLVALSGLRTR